MAVSAKYKTSLGKKIKKMREASGYSQRKTALSVGITNAALSDIENGINFPSETVLINLIKHLKPSQPVKTDIYDMFSEAKDSPPPDISQFLKSNYEICNLIRCCSRKVVTTESLEDLKAIINDLEDKNDEE